MLTKYCFRSCLLYTSWLDIFGERLILQKPEDMELFPAVEKGFSYLLLFTDDVKIDLTLLPLELIDEYFTDVYKRQSLQYCVPCRWR